ncbi:MAG: T9SS type A sorting domain-containing protein, partial [Bacteroidota bacterium]
MKTILYYLIVAFLFAANLANAQERTLAEQQQFQQTATLECKNGEMLHDFVNTNFTKEQEAYQLGGAPEGDYTGDIFYSADGSKIFIANSYSNNITILNADGTLSDNISVGSYPLTLALNDDYAVVPCSMSSDVYIIDLSDNSIAATIALNGEPVTVEILGAKAYVGCDTDPELLDECAIIDLSTLTLENTITNFPVKLTSVAWTFNNGRRIYTYNNFAVSDDNTYLIAGNWTDKINFYNTTTAAIDYELNATEPKRVSKSGDGSTVAVFCPNDVCQVDIATHSITETVNLGPLEIPYPYNGISNQEGSKAFVALDNNNSGFVNFTNSTLNTVSATKKPAWIGVNPDRTKVISGQYRFRILDFNTEEILGQYDGLGSEKGAVAPDLSYVAAINFASFEGPFFFNTSNLDNIFIDNYVLTGEDPEGDAPMRVNITPDGQKALIINELSHNISVFDIPTRTFTNHIELGGAPMEIDITSDGNYAVVTTAYIQSEIVVIDINAGTVVKEISAGEWLQAVEILPDDSKAYIRDYQDKVFVVNLDGASSSLETTITSCGMGTYSSFSHGIFGGLVATPDGSHLFVSSTWNDEVIIINTETDAIVNHLATGDSPYFFDFNEAGNRAIVCDISDDIYSLIDVDGANTTVINSFNVGGEMAFRLAYNGIKDEFGITVYGNEFYDDGGKLLTVDANTGEEISTVNFTSEDGNALQVLYDIVGNPIVLTENKIIYGTEEYVFPEKVKYMAYSQQENVALAISSIDDNLHVIDFSTINIENFNISTNSFVLKQNTPNPAKGFTTINYEIKETGNVELSVFDNSGKLIQHYISGIQDKGNYFFEIETSDYISGIYFYKLSVNNQSQTKKMIV